MKVASLMHECNLERVNFTETASSLDKITLILEYSFILSAPGGDGHQI